LRENDIDIRPRVAPFISQVLIPTVASERESAIVEDPDLIALSKAEANIKLIVKMNGVRC